MTSLPQALAAVDWSQNVNDFVTHTAFTDTFERGCRVVGLWAHEIAFQDCENYAAPFLLEMKASLMNAPVCFALGLYKPGASAMRAALENSLYYTYFSCHPKELETLINSPKYYISKNDIMEFHKIHCRDFGDKQHRIGFIGELDAWYSEISAIVHGQIPGSWTSKGVSSTAFDADLDTITAKYFSRCVALINMLFILTIPEDIWDGFNSKARRLFLKGLSGQKKSIIGRSLI